MKYKYHVLAGTVVTLFLCFAWAPFAVKAYAERKVPGVKIGDVGLQWGQVVFQKVLVNRPNVKGYLDEVTVAGSLTDGVTSVRIRGGNLQVELNTSDSEQTSNRLSGLPSIHVSELKASVTKGEANAIIEGIVYERGFPEFDSITLNYKGHSLSGTKGSYVDGTLFIDSVSASEELPYEIPEIPKGPYKVQGKDFQLHIKERKLELLALDVGDFLTVGYAYVDAQHVELEGVLINHPWVSPETLIPKLGLTKEDDLVTVKLGKVTLKANLKDRNISGEGSCSDWVESLPYPSPEALLNAKESFKGDLSWEVTKTPEPDLKLKNQCRFECSAEPAKTLLNVVRGGGTLTYKAYDKNNEIFERKVGPRISNWVRHNHLPPWVSKAFVTFEDPGFYRHRGIIPQALENSFKANIQVGGFFRGGSTITMQLAKNLWLTREKSLNRKAQEALLTTVLESCLTKQEILELYVNVVEFGPDIYGIGNAAKKYFDSYPEHLTPEEAFYLASILPAPRRALPPNQGGLDRVRRRMKRLVDNGFLTEDDLPPESALEHFAEIKGEEWVAD